MDYPKSKAAELGLVADKFADYNPVGDVAGSIVPGVDWANPVTDEILATIVEAGLVPTEGVNTQLRDAVKGIVANNPSVPRGFIDGLTLSNNGTVAIDVAAGIARDGADAANIALAAALTNKQLNVAWAVGASAGMLDTGAIAANSWYHIWLIRRSDTGVVDVLASLSATAPTMPANYDQKRRIGAVLTDATPDIIAFRQHGDKFFWIAPAADYTDTGASGSRILHTLTVPTGLKLQPLHAHWFSDNGAAGIFYSIITDPDDADAAPTSTLHTARAYQHGMTVMVQVLTDTSARIGKRTDVSGGNILTHGVTYGWIDPRGRNA